MEQAKMVFQKLLHPSKWVLIFVPPLSLAALIFIFATQTTVKFRKLGSPILSAAIAVIMLLCSRKTRKKVEMIE